MSDILDEKLRAIISGDILGDWAVEEIKQAFTEAGYVQIPQVEVVEKFERGKPTEYRVNGKVVMAGQQWYERFKTELEKQQQGYSSVVSDYLHDPACVDSALTLQATVDKQYLALAKRAAGIQESYDTTA